MNRVKALISRNFTEMLRDPMIYIFCLAFPIVMLALFYVIESSSPDSLPVFQMTSLLPGVMMFSFTFVMLMMVLLVSKDKQTALLKRLYISPTRPHEFVLGYAVCGLIIGLCQAVICSLAAEILCLLSGSGLIGVGTILLLILSQLPILFVFVFLGLIIGSLFNDKSGPGVTSVIISAGGILGGAWMPLDTMAGFETVCRFLPFYPSVYWGRIITGASHSDLAATPYAMDSVAWLGIIPVAVFLIGGAFLAFYLFRKQMKSEK